MLHRVADAGVAVLLNPKRFQIVKDCRVFEYDGKTYEVPTKEMLADAILKTLYTPSACACTPYVMPENLKRFYEGKNTSGNGCCCKGDSL